MASTRSSTSAAVKESRAGSSVLGALVDLLPGHRRRDRGLGTRPQRVDGDRRLRRVVLAPVDEHLAAAQRLAHVGHDELGVLPLEPHRDALGVLPHLVPRRPSPERHVELQPLGAARLRDAPPASPILEDVRDQRGRPCSTRRSTPPSRDRGRTPCGRAARAACAVCRRARAARGTRWCPDWPPRSRLGRSQTTA